MTVKDIAGGTADMSNRNIPSYTTGCIQKGCFRVVHGSGGEGEIYMASSHLFLLRGLEQPTLLDSIMLVAAAW